MLVGANGMNVGATTIAGVVGSTLSNDPAGKRAKLW